MLYQKTYNEGLQAKSEISACGSDDIRDTGNGNVLETTDKFWIPSASNIYGVNWTLYGRTLSDGDVQFDYYANLDPAVSPTTSDSRLLRSNQSLYIPKYTQEYTWLRTKSEWADGCPLIINDPGKLGQHGGGSGQTCIIVLCCCI